MGIIMGFLGGSKQTYEVKKSFQVPLSPGLDKCRATVLLVAS